MSINTLGEHALSGQEAIQALNVYIEELESQKNTDKTSEHVDMRIDIARALCQAILNFKYTPKTEEEK